MQHHSTLRHTSALLAALALSMAGCNQTAPTPQPQSKSEAQARSKPLVIQEIRVGPHAGDGQAPVRPQTPRDPIVISIKTSGASAGADLEVKLFELSNGQQAGIETRRLKTTAVTTTELVFKREQPWNPGRYLVEVKLDGKLAGQRDLDIVDFPVKPAAAKPSP